MILKLCYQNEIHRCSNPPNELVALHSLLSKTFRIELPEDLCLFYSIPDGTENIALLTQEDYQTLLSLQTSKPVKVVIRGKDQDRKLSSEEAMGDIIPEHEQIKDQQILKDEKKNDDQYKPLLEDCVDKISDAVVPQIKKYSYFSHAEDQDDHVKKIVQDTLKEQMPFIISQVRDAILKELRVPIYLPQPNEEIPKGPNNLKEEFKVQERRRNSIVDIFDNEKQDNLNNSENKEEAREKPKKNKIVNKIKTFVKEQIAELPGKAKHALENLSQKLEGDPYVECKEGRFRKSVVEKATLMKEIFPEEQDINLLNFVKKCPNHATLEQLADFYLRKSEQQVEEVAENDEIIAEDGQKKDDNNN